MVDVHLKHSELLGFQNAIEIDTHVRIECYTGNDDQHSVRKKQFDSGAFSSSFIYSLFNSISICDAALECYKTVNIFISFYFQL